MSESILPVPARNAIRHKWEKVSPDVQSARLSLSVYLACSVEFSVDWLTLHRQIRARVLPSFDSGQIIEYVVNGIHSWLNVMLEFEVWQDPKSKDWLQVVPSPRGGGAFCVMKVMVRAVDGKKAMTTWDEHSGCFTIDLPNAPLSTNIGEEYERQFRNLVLKELRKPLKALPVQTQTGFAEAETRVVQEPKSENDSFVAPPVNGDDCNHEAVRSMDKLLDNPPYHLLVKAVSKHSIEIQSSYLRSLDLLAKYFERSTAIKPSQGETKASSILALRNCDTRVSESLDVLTLTCAKGCDGPMSISPMAVLAVVEGVLGYELVHTEAGYWHYRRTTPFKKQDT